MELNYTPAESTIKQPEIEVGRTTVYFRRNFVETEKTDMDGESTTTVWVYEEAQLTKDQALYVLAEQQNTTTQAVQDADAMNIDQEYRLTLLELGV